MGSCVQIYLLQFLWWREPAGHRRQHENAQLSCANVRDTG
jgi:hypothetical protein